MAKYDINDPTDVDIMRAQFDMVSPEEWEKYVEFAEHNNIGYKKENVLKSCARKAGMSKFLSPKVIIWVLAILDELDIKMDEKE